MSIMRKKLPDARLIGGLLAGTMLAMPAVALDQTIVAPHGMVVAGHPMAVESGMKALRAGGTACDAFVATAATLSIMLNDMMGPLGSGYALLYTPERGNSDVRAIDYNGVAPAATDVSLYQSMEDKRRGILAPTVPGNLKGWQAIHDDCGVLPWAALWEDAIEYAENGWAVDPFTSNVALGGYWVELAPFPTWGEQFLTPEGDVPPPGYILKRPELAATYRIFAEMGADAVYDGPVGDQIVAFMEKEGGLITKQDLTDYAVIWGDPLKSSYRGYTVYGNQPSSSSITWMQILNIMDGYEDLAEIGWNSPEYLRRSIEATKFAYQDAYAHNADPRFVDVPVDRLLSQEQAAEYRAEIDKGEVREFKPYQDAFLYQPPVPNHSTSHIVVHDAFGNAVSGTNTHGAYWGSGVVVEGTGLLLSNGMDWFDITENVWTGEKPGPLVMEPGKRNRWTLSPGMLFNGDNLYMLVGSAGAESTMWGISQPIMNAIDFGMDPQQALDAPRYRYGDVYHYTGGTAIGLEAGIAPETRDALLEMGYEVEEIGQMKNPARGTTQMIIVDPDSGALWGGAAPNGRDFVAGY